MAHRTPVGRSEDDLDPAACWDLLGTTSVGRLGLSVHALPSILPVRFTVDRGAVVISVGPFGPPATVHDEVVAFAADRIDEASAAGWIVQMQGRARLAPAGPGPADGARVVLLEPATMSGRRFALPPLPSGG